MHACVLIAIAIIERGNILGDITKTRIEAIQMGLLCCVELNNSQKQREFEHQLSELGIPMPGLEQAKNKVHMSIYTNLRYDFLPYLHM